MVGSCQYHLKGELPPSLAKETNKRLIIGKNNRKERMLFIDMKRNYIIDFIMFDNFFQRKEQKNKTNYNILMQ